MSTTVISTGCSTIRSAHQDHVAWSIPPKQCIQLRSTNPNSKKQSQFVWMTWYDMDAPTQVKCDLNILTRKLNVMISKRNPLPESLFPKLALFSSCRPLIFCVQGCAMGMVNTNLIEDVHYSSPNANRILEICSHTQQKAKHGKTTVELRRLAFSIYDYVWFLSLYGWFDFNQFIVKLSVCVCVCLQIQEDLHPTSPCYLVRPDV